MSYSTFPTIKHETEAVRRAQGVAPSPAPLPTSDLIRALELGRDHAKWSVDRSTDATERRMNQLDVDRINAAIAAARGVKGDGNG